MKKTIKENSGLYSVWLIMILCISIGVATTQTLSVAAMGLFAVYALFAPLNNSCILLFGLLPFANIFKYQAGATSFFTICEMIVACISLVKYVRLKINLILSLLVFLIYVLITSFGDVNLLALVKLILGLYLIYVATSTIQRKDLVSVAYLLAASTILMMLLSTNPQYFLHIQPYLLDLNFLVNSSGRVTDIMREGGFFGDPNYCSVVIVMSVALLSVLYYYKEIKTEFWVFVAFLIPLGFVTYSKSYFICVAILASLLVLFVLFPKHKGWAIITVGVLFAVVFLILDERIEIINIILDRFKGKDVTTGRIDINNHFLNYIFDHPKVLFFGEGINADKVSGMGNTVHNIYIETLFKLGMVGGTLYLSAVIAASNIKKRRIRSRKKVNYLPLFFVLLQYFALAGVVMYEFPFYLAIAFMSINFNTEKENGLYQYDGVRG